MESDLLSSWKLKLQKLESKLAEIEGSELSAAIHAMSFNDLWTVQGFNEEQLESFLYSETLSDSFRDQLLSQYHRLELNPNRSNLLEQAVMLHRDSMFSGSVPLLYSQIEGVITDALSKAKFLRAEGRLFIEMWQGKEKFNNKGKFIEVKGLDRKIELSKNLDSDLWKFFESMSSAELIFGDKESKVVITRNKILHGNDLSFWLSHKRSTQLMLWLYGLVFKLAEVEFNK